MKSAEYFVKMWEKIDRVKHSVSPSPKQRQQLSAVPQTARQLAVFSVKTAARVENRTVGIKKKRCT